MAALSAARLYVATGAVLCTAAVQNIRRRVVATPAVSLRSHSSTPQYDISTAEHSQGHQGRDNTNTATHLRRTW